jgi:putative ABC transport system permease protein
MMLIKIAFRNILRNARRSLMTMSAVAAGAIAMILFGGFMENIITGFQTTTVQRTDHLTVYRSGYFTYGAGNPAAWGIHDYQTVLQLIRDDPVLQPMLNVITPTVTLYGLAGNFDIDASRTFLGTGFIPSDRDRMRTWDEYRLYPDRIPTASGLRDDDPTLGVIGVGLARVLGLCESLKLADCPPRPPTDATANTAGAAVQDFSDLTKRDVDPAHAAGGAVPHIDLLAATAGGAPNVVTLNIARAELQGVKELDDAYVAMHFSLAQQLLYGRGEHQAVGIVLQLHRTEDMAPARARLVSLFKDHRLDLEVRDFGELVPFYREVIGLFGAIFAFIAVIMGVIVLFAVVNTMSMSVMERTNEIGTARAMGVRRRGIRRQFVIEGWMLGAIGATAGLVFAFIIAVVANHSGMTWQPPGQSAPVPLRVMATGIVVLQGAVWLGLVLMATIAAVIPANRGARLPVVDALRHV